MKLRFEADATAELEEALNWYAARSPATEIAFAAAIDDALAKVVSTPYRFVRFPPCYRACTVIKYPYQIFYRIDGEFIVVTAIAHTSRRPGYWKRRR